jgi:hypothetical protein
MDTLDRMFGQTAARQRQPLTDHADRQRSRDDDPQGSAGQRLYPLGVQIIAQKPVQKAVDAVK